MNKIIMKLLDSEIWIYNHKLLIKNNTKTILKNNFIINNKTLQEELKKIITKHKLKNTILQNKIIILINKLYCETNISIIKDIMYNLGFSNYKLVYEEELYKDINKNILSIWNTNGIFIQGDKEEYIELHDIKNFNEIKCLLITSCKEVIETIKQYFPNMIIYENTKDAIFNMID